MIEMTPDLLRRVLDGDQDAQEEARALLPKVGNIFGQWATHPKYGRVLCVSDNVDHDGLVIVYYPDTQHDCGSNWQCLPFDSLEFDPVELVTEQDFQNAPEGTIVIAYGAYGPYIRMKCENVWVNEKSRTSSIAMPFDVTWQVVRWGMGEQA